MTSLAPLNKILVPLDGSALAECGLRAAATLVSPDQGELVLIRVPAYTEMPISAGHTPFMADAAIISDQYDYTRNEAGQYLESAARRLVHAGLQVSTMVLDGECAGALIGCAAAESADLIVMTTHGRTGLSRWMMGSVTERVLRSSPCPVLALRPSPECAAKEPDTRPLTHILVALDGSHLAERTIPVALAIATRLAIPVTLFHAYAVRNNSHSRREMEQYLQRQRATWSHTGVHLDTTLHDVMDHSPSHIAATVIAYAEETGMGLIALTTHGRVGLERRLVGSVTERILHGTRGGLLVVRPN